MIIRKISFLLISLIALNILTAQNSFKSDDGWGAGWWTNDYWSGTGFGTTFGKTYKNSSGAGNRYFRLHTDWSGQNRTHGPAGNNDILVSLSTPTPLETWGADGKAYYVAVSGSQNQYNYVFRTRYGDGISNTPELIVFEVQGEIRTIASITQVPDVLNVGTSSSVTVTAELNGNINPGQGVYLRYSTSPNWSTSTTTEMTGSGNLFSAVIPQYPANTVVRYYVFTSGNNMTVSHENADFYTINGNTNNGSNFSYTVFPGVVSVNPAFPNDTEPVTITLDANGTDLAGASKVYMHAGVSVNQADLKSFSYVKGNWGQDDGIGEMTNVSGNTWQIVLNAGIRQYFSVPVEKDIFGLNFLFRNAAGDKKVDKNGQNYHNAVNPGSYFTTNALNVLVNFVQTGNDFGLSATANVTPNTWTLTEIDVNTNAWIANLATQNGNLTFTHNIYINTTDLRKFKLEVDFGGTIKYKTFLIRGFLPLIIAPRPIWTKPGINYHTSDPTKATLVLHAPTYTIYKKGTGTISGTNTTTPKTVVYVVGDFNNWVPSEPYKLNRDRDGWDGTNDGDNDGDRGDYWWIELSGLVQGQEYVFQYMIDGNLQLADPYSQKISDPDDQYISSAVYPDLISYRPEATDRASGLQTNQPAYNWTAPAFSKPNINELNIYELHFRDFTDEGTYLAAIDKLDYIKGLRINAIHVMPVSEFEGNSSWGYNPNFYFAPDKAYGTANDLKKFIDECHKRKILVFNDMVLNHAFYSNVMAKMYWNSALNKPANDNPWFNPDHKMVYDPNGHWGADWNHESEHVQTMVDRILDHWLQDFNFDGFRFDFTKGFGQTAPDPNDPWAGSKDQDRIDLLLRMANGMKSRNPGSVVIFEHLAENDEEKTLADQGILMWSGVGHHNAIKNFTIGWPGDNTDIYSSGAYNSSQNGFSNANLISYAESHDEQRQGYEVKSYFNWAAFAGPKTTAADSLNAIIDRLKIGLGFNLLLPGPRMLWEFQELGYDVSIDFNGRTGEKPVRWNYLENDKRKELLNFASKVFKLRNNFNIYSTAPDYGNIGLGAGNITTPRVMRFSSSDSTHVIIVANLDPSAGHNVSPQYDVTGTWYKYNGNPSVDGTPFTVSSTADTYYLQFSECFIFTNFKIDNCLDVLKTSNAGENTLRDAIECAEDGDTVLINYSVYNDTITLTSPITIDDDIVIKGFPSKKITIDGTGFSGNVFSITAGKSVTINGMKILCSQGNSDGRCIINYGNLTLDNMELDESGPPSSGSTLLNQGTSTTLIIKNSVDLK